MSWLRKLTGRADKASKEDGAPEADPLGAALERLKSRHVEERRRALGALAALADPGTRPALIATLEDEDVDVRGQAASLLMTLGGTDELLTALSHANPDVRGAAIYGLAASTEPRVVEALAGRVIDSSPQVRVQVVWELARGLTDRGLEVVLNVALGSGEKALRERAVHALATFGPQNVPFLVRVLAYPPASGPERAQALAVEALTRHPSAAAVEALTCLLESSRGELREFVAVALGRTEDPRAVPALRHALLSDDPRLQQQAVLALANIGDRESAEPIRELLASPDPLVQTAAIAALGRLRDAGAIDAICGCVADAKLPVRLAAVEVLQSLGGSDPRVIAHLCTALQDRTPNVRRAAARGLAVHGHPNVLPALQERLDKQTETDAQVRELAQAAISRIQKAGRRRAAGTSASGAETPMFTGRLVPSAPELSTVGPIPTRLTCKSCKGPCHEVLVVPGEQIGRPGRTFRVIRCLNCYFEGPYYVHFKGGAPVRVTYEYADDQEFIEEQPHPIPRASIRWDAGPPAREQGAWGWETLAGAAPSWLQTPQWPQCRECGAEMQFILQLASATLDTSRPGNDLGYAFHLSIEHYATLYLFDCSACQITASICQCT